MGKNIFSKEAVLILAACFCFMSCHTMIIPILAGFTGSLGGSGLLMGTVVGITNLVSIGFRIVSGPMVDRVTKRQLSQWGAALMLAGCLGCALTVDTWLLLAVAPSLGINLERAMGFRPVFWGAVISAALIIVLTMGVGHKGERTDAARTAGQRGRFRLLETSVIPIALIVTLFTIPYTATQSFLVQIVRQTGAAMHPELFFAAYAIALVCMRVGFRNYFDRVPYRRFLALCTISATVSMLLLGTGGNNLTLIAAAVCMAGGFGIMCSESQATAMTMVDNSKRGLANNTYLIGLDCGMALGPMTGGLLYSHAQVQYFYPWLMITAVLGIAVYLIGRKRLSRL